MEKQSQNPMAVEPIPRLMARIGTPIVLSMPYLFCLGYSTLC